MNPFKLTIARPCHENWENMNPTEKGRFCQACTKTVVDFTQKTPAQMQALLQHAGDTVCGRFNANDLNRVLVPEKIASEKKTRPWFTWIALFALLGFHKKSMAYPLSYNDNEEKTLFNRTQVKTGETVVRGEIKNNKTREGIPYASVRIFSGGKEIGKGTSSDKGLFEIMVPADSIYDFKIDVRCEANEFEPYAFNGMPAFKKEISVAIGMTCEPAILLDEVEIIQIQQGLIGYENTTITDFHPHAMLGGVCYNTVEKIDHVPYHETENVKPVDTVDVSVQVYPNPTTDFVTVYVRDAKQASIRLFDANGQLLQSFSSQESRNTIDLSRYENGAYLVQVMDDATHKTIESRVVKVN